MHKTIALLFIIFAAVQYNDPDFLIWIPAYLLVSILIILWERGLSVKVPLRLAILGYIVWMLTYTPDVIDWIGQGLPSIIGSMKAESPFIEFVREFFGLILCLGACIYYARKERS